MKLNLEESWNFGSDAQNSRMLRKARESARNMRVKQSVRNFSLWTFAEECYNSSSRRSTRAEVNRYWKKNDGRIKQGEEDDQGSECWIIPALMVIKVVLQNVMMDRGGTSAVIHGVARAGLFD